MVNFVYIISGNNNQEPTIKETSKVSECDGPFCAYYYDYPVEGGERAKGDVLGYNAFVDFIRDSGEPFSVLSIIS
jgi:hypothetical protein